MAKFEPIENHGIVGDLNTVALVALDGTVDFCCFPRFDSPTIFASLLDPERGGHFRISPELNGAKRKQLYLPDSNVLLTRILSSEGVAEIYGLSMLTRDLQDRPDSATTFAVVARSES